MTNQITIQRTTSDHNDFKELAKALEQELRIRDGDDHLFYADLNKIDSLPNAIIAYSDGLPVGCGALRIYDQSSVEFKRMYVDPSNRRQSIATLILAELEKWSIELGYTKCLLETGLNQPEAIELYKKNYYSVIPNFGKYTVSKNSICFEKNL